MKLKFRKTKLTKKQEKNIIRILITGICFLILQFLNLSPVWNLIAYLLVYLFISYDILCKAFKGIINRKFLDENFLMSVATIGAFALAIYEKSNNYNEALAVIFLYQIGEFFQSYAVSKSRKNITELMDLRPDFANVLVDGEIQKTDPFDVEIGSIIIVNPGEKIPLDGEIIEGVSSVDTAAITGESMPVYVEESSEVYSGCINVSGMIKVKTTKAFEESTASKLLKLVTDASSEKSEHEEFITKFARVYTPVVCSLALIIAILPPVIKMILNQSPMWDQWIYRSLVFLVIGCPCALVLSIPLSFFAGMGGASRNGILIKGSNYIEQLSKITKVIMDKTGTLTEGVFKVVAIHHNKIDEKKILEYAAYAESASSHPIAKSVKDAYSKELDISRVKDITEIAGQGVQAFVDGHEVLVGNRKLMETNNLDYIKCSEIGTVLHVALDKEYLGHILINDAIKPGSKQTIEKLRKLGISKITMLTGDKKNVAESVAKELNIDDFHSELLPENKLETVKSGLNKGDTVLFVGDGLNDAPALSAADIGMAMGAMGVDASIEAADVVLMDDNPENIPKSIKTAKNIMKIVNENIYGVLGVKVLSLILGALGIIGLKIAIFADVGVMILAVLNSMRTLYIKKS